MKYALLLLLAGCALSSEETIEGPCVLEKIDNVMWPSATRTLKIECEEGGRATTTEDATVEPEDPEDHGAPAQ